MPAGPPRFNGKRPRAPRLQIERGTPRLRGRRAVDQRARRVTEANFTCTRCGCIERPTNKLVVDHIVPLAHGGSDDDSNTRVVCADCHIILTAEQFGHRKRVRIGTDGFPIEE